MPDTPARRFRFSLITLIVVVNVLGVILWATIHYWPSGGLGPLCSRLEKSRAGVRAFIKNPHKGRPVEMNHQLLAELLAADQISLQAPRVATAVIFENAKMAHLFVFWVEARPTADTVQLVFEPDDEVVSLPIMPIDHELNLKEAEEVVVYCADYQWDKTSKIWKALNSQRAQCSVRLLRDGEVVSNSVRPLWHNQDTKPNNPASTPLR